MLLLLLFLVAESLLSLLYRALYEFLLPIFPIMVLEWSSSSRRSLWWKQMLLLQSSRRPFSLFSGPANDLRRGSWWKFVVRDVLHRQLLLFQDIVILNQDVVIIVLKVLLCPLVYVSVCGDAHERIMAWSTFLMVLLHHNLVSAKATLFLNRRSAGQMLIISECGSPRSSRAVIRRL